MALQCWGPKFFLTCYSMIPRLLASPSWIKIYRYHIPASEKGEMHFHSSWDAGARVCRGSLVAQMVKIFLQWRKPQFDSWVRKNPWRIKWLPTPVFLSGKIRGQRNLAGYHPWHWKELDTTEQVTVMWPHQAVRITGRWSLFWVVMCPAKSWGFYY